MTIHNSRLSSFAKIYPSLSKHSIFAERRTAKPPCVNPYYSANVSQKSKLTCKLIVTKPITRNQTVFKEPLNFLNYFFIARLRDTCKIPVTDLDNSNYNKLVAKKGNVEIAIEPESICLVGQSHEELSHMLWEIAILIYSMSSTISLQIECEDKKLEYRLRQLLADAYQEIEKTRQDEIKYVELYDTKPSAPPAYLMCTN